MTSENSERAQNSFQTQFENSIRDPLRNVLVAIGDFNRARDNARFYIDPLDQAEHAANPSIHTYNLSAHAKAWDAHCSKLTEVDFSYTHYSSEGKFESAIDRLFCIFLP